MKPISRSLSIATVLLSLAGANSSEAGFVNGSFETGDTTGWTFSADGFNLNPFGTTFGSGMDGLWWAWLAGFEAPRFMEQTVTGLTPGATYGVNFIMASEATFSDSIFVSADGGLSQQFTAPPYNGGFWDTWVSKEFDFTAAGTSSTIRFSTFGIDPSTQLDVGIDNVTITALNNAVPEPVSLALFGIALTAMGLARRRNPS